VTVTHRGQTSAGPLQAPYPTGTILGSLSGSYHFYVVDKGSAPLQVDGPGETWLKPGAGPIGFSIQAPEGWTNLTVHRTTVMPGFLLEDVTGNDLSFTYDAPTLAQTFPNLDLEDRDGVMGVDTITLSVLLQGLDAEGNPQFRARQLLLQGEQLMRPLQKRSDDMFGSDFER
jgi:hypothetical protein